MPSQPADWLLASDLRHWGRSVPIESRLCAAGAQKRAGKTPSRATEHRGPRTGGETDGDPAARSHMKSRTSKSGWPAGWLAGWLIDELGPAKNQQVVELLTGAAYTSAIAID